MAHSVACFIRKNSPELLESLENSGLHICPCCRFEDSVWLSHQSHNLTIHGIGFSDGTAPTTVEQELEIFLNQREDGCIDCGENESLFIALSRYQDDTDDNQVFINKLGDWGIYHETTDEFPGFEFNILPRSFDTNQYHKATVKELINLFKNE